MGWNVRLVIPISILPLYVYNADCVLSLQRKGSSQITDHSKQHTVPAARERSFPGQGACTYIIPLLFASLLALFFLSGVIDTYQSQGDQHRDYAKRYEPNATKIDECLRHYRLFPSLCGLTPAFRYAIVWIKATFPPGKRPDIDTRHRNEQRRLRFFANIGYRQNDILCRVVIRRPRHPFIAEHGYVLLEVNQVTRLRVPVKSNEQLTLAEGVKRCLQ